MSLKYEPASVSTTPRFSVNDHQFDHRLISRGRGKGGKKGGKKVRFTLPQMLTNPEGCYAVDSLTTRFVCTGTLFGARSKVVALEI